MYLKRKIYKILAENLENNKIIILTGARQVGKTSLMKKLSEEVKKDKNTAFLDMDMAANLGKGESLEKFMDFLYLNGYTENSERFYIFVDEFQRSPNLANIFKNIYDHYKNIKIIASGSSSLTIKNNSKESLAGRKFIFEVHPLDFEEFLIFKQDEKALGYYRNIPKLKSSRAELPELLNKYLNEFLMFGGYPEVALTDGRENKKKLLESIFDLYIEKDIMIFSDIENIPAFKKILEILAVNNGQLINYDRLSKEAGIHNRTVRSYLSLIEDTYIVKEVKPFHSNKNKELVKTPKYYFLDIGVRNYFLNNFSHLEKRVDKGQIWETYILQELLKNGFNKVKFWRTKTGKELDLILEEEGGVLPVEAKYESKGKKSHLNNILYFLDTYGLSRGFLLSKNFNKELTENGKIVHAGVGINFFDLLRKGCRKIDQ